MPPPLPLPPGLAAEGQAEDSGVEESKQTAPPMRPAEEEAAAVGAALGVAGRELSEEEGAPLPRTESEGETPLAGSARPIRGPGL